VPLSEHEQRLFDQIEQSLAKDPKFASAVRASDPRFHTRRRVIFAVLIGIVGFGLVIAGPISKAPIISVVGFVVAFGAMVFGVQSVRRGRNGGTLKSVGGTATRSTRVRRVSFIDRLEDRWRGRPEGQ
jgi:multisubunit Na+/H+ antiporter MnhB subunit